MSAERARQHSSDAAKLTGDKRRRAEARAACEMHYSLHAPEIADRFPHSMLESFMQTYMSDAQDASDVERRGVELRRLIDRHKEVVEPPKRRVQTIHDLAQWYLGEKDRIESLPLDDELKQIHLVQLDMRYAALSQSILEGAEP